MSPDTTTESETSHAVCPRCFTHAVDRSNKCRACALRVPTRDGIPSLTDRVRQSPLLDRETTDSFVTVAQNESFDRAVREVIAPIDHDGSIRAALFDPGAHDWRLLVSEHLSGTCLDLHAGSGLRSLLLAEQVDRVYAVDPSIDALRFLDARTDYASVDHVHPIHADFESIAWSDELFDTIVVGASLFDSLSPTSMTTAFDQLRKALTEDGSLLVIADGWLRRSGLSDILGLERVTPPHSERCHDLGQALQATPSQYRSLFETVGFDTVDMYSLLPNRDLSKYTFETGTDRAVEWILDSELSSNSTRHALARSFASVGAKLGVIEQTTPSFLFVCTDSERGVERTAREDSSALTPRSESLLVRGRCRSVRLEFENDELVRVVKLPNRTAHDTFVTREHDVLSTLNSIDAPITETLPSGRCEQTACGPAYIEQAVSGTAATFDPDSIDQFRTLLGTVFEWLVRFQRTYAGESVTRSPSEIRDDLTVDGFDLRPPSVSDPVTMVSTPSHGDFCPGNLLFEEGAISMVIDWEFATLTGYPVTDPAYFVLQMSKAIAGDLETGLEEVLAGTGPYASILQATIRDYCAAVGIAPRAFCLYLAYPRVRRLRWYAHKSPALRYTKRPEERAVIISLIWEYYEAIRHRLCENDSTAESAIPAADRQL